jgi:ribosome-binding factor A
MKSYPRSRVTGETVREVIARTLLEDVKDPRVEFVTVTGVAMSPDRRHANVFVTAHGDAEHYERVLAGLNSAKGRLRAVLGQAVRMKYVPDLHFAIDPSVDYAERIYEVLASERAAGRAPSEQDDALAADAPAEVAAAGENVAGHTAPKADE